MQNLNLPRRRERFIVNTFDHAAYLPTNNLCGGVVGVDDDEENAKKKKVG